MANHDDIDYISANDLLNNRFNGRSDELYSNNRDAQRVIKIVSIIYIATETVVLGSDAR